MISKLYDQLSHALRDKDFLSSKPGEYQQTVLDDASDLIDHYQAVIENRTGTSLGDVQTRLESDLTNDLRNAASEEATRRMVRQSIREDRTPNTYDLRLGQLETTVAHVFLTVTKPFRKAQKPNGYDAFYTGATNNIYLNMDQVPPPSQASRKRHLTQVALHELSHAWWKAEQDTMPVESLTASTETQTYWKEGFAYYTTQHHFDDLTDQALIPPQGKRKQYKLFMQHVIRREGQDVLPNIPNKWPELDKKHRDLRQVF